MKSPIEIKAVKSTDILGIGFNKEIGMLGVAFHTGYIYLYPNCQNSDFAEFMKAESKGKWFAEHLKRRADHIKISPKQDPLVDALKGSIQLVKMARSGGKARAAKLTKQQRTDIASKAASTRWQKKGAPK